MAVMKKSNKEDAVSPVIGVMLMLVVTIVIAAVVAAFASGMGTDMDTAPNAALKVVVTDNSVVLSSISGDKIDLSKVLVSVYSDDDSEILRYEKPSGSSGVGQYLESGETLDLNKGATPSPDQFPEIGDKVEVIVLYDYRHIIYDSEVIVE